MLHRYDLYVRLAELDDAELRMYLSYVALAPFKDGVDRQAGIVDVTFDALLKTTLKTWSKPKASRVRKSLIGKGWLNIRDKRLVVVNHYPLYKAKVKDMKLIIQLMKPGTLLTEQDISQMKQNMIRGLTVDRQNLAKKFTIPPSNVP